MDGYTTEQQIAERPGLYPSGDDVDMRFEVVAVAKRRAYGRQDFYIRPHRGIGGRWVAEGSVIWNQEQEGER